MTSPPPELVVLVVEFHTQATVGADWPCCEKVPSSNPINEIVNDVGIMMANLEIVDVPGDCDLPVNNEFVRHAGIIRVDLKFLSFKVVSQLSIEQHGRYEELV
jgi:hypothetical protein